MAILRNAVYSGLHPKDTRDTRQLLGNMKWLDIDAEAAEAAGFMSRDFSAKGRTGRLW